MDSYLEHDAVFNLDHKEIRPRSTFVFSQLEIKFDFYFTYQHNTCIRSQDSEFLECSPPLYDRTSAVVAVGESLSFDDIAAAVEDSVDGRLLGGDREGLIELACAEVRKRLETLPEDVALVLSFDVKIVDRHVYVVDESDDCPRMVLAADSSFALLEKYDLDHGVGDGKVEGGRCCICLEGLAGAGGGVLRMPRWHMFHGGCVEEWLRRSHYCPLCRYEMPMK